MNALVEPVTGGDPSSTTRFVRRSLRNLSAELWQQGHDACPDTVADLLNDLGISLRVNVKRFTGPCHPDRDRQFRYIEEMIASFRDEDLPVISVDAKKKELIGNFANRGVAWVRQPYEVNAHDFVRDALCRATPYGVYDVLAKRGHVTVGTSATTPEFAVAVVAHWWGRYGCRRYRDAGEVLILADAGGSNGCRPRLWKAQLQERLADRFGLWVTVCHYPTGASKWNPVEHRLFGPISAHWAGVPLRTPEVLLGEIRGTQSGELVVTADWDDRRYEKGIKVTNQAMQELVIERHEICPQWNYTIKPRPWYQWN